MVVCFLLVFAMSGAVFAADDAEGTVTISGNDWLTESQVLKAADVLLVPDDFTGSYQQEWTSDRSSVVDLTFYYGQNPVARAIVNIYSGEVVAIEQYYTPAVFSFKDTVPGNWYYDSVKFVYDHSIMYGTGLEYFEPNTVTSRAMLATILYRMEGSPSVSAYNPFVDVPLDQWYTSAVIWASKYGIVNGFGNGLFKPNDPITREQMATMLYRFALYKGDRCEPGSGTNYLLYGLMFSDISSISDYAKNAMRWAVGESLITGMGDGILAPQGQATRAQMATILNRCYYKYYR